MMPHSVFGIIQALSILNLQIQIGEAQLRTNFKVTRSESCKSNTLVKFVVNITTEKDNKQYITFSLITPIAFDNTIGATFLIESMLDDKIVLPIFTIREKYCCQAAHKYMGEFLRDMYRAVGLPPGICPIPVGRYHAHHVYMDFSKVALQTFPFGRLRFTFNLIENKKPKESLWCQAMEVENQEN